MRDRVNQLGDILLGRHGSLHGGQPLLNRVLTAVAPGSQPEQFIQSLLKLRIVHTTSCSLYRSKLACCTICYSSRRPLHAEEKNWFYPRSSCLLYTSDAADDLTRVDLGGRRIIKKKKKK